MLDETDKRLLSELQKNAHLTAQELGDVLNLSPSQAGRRRQRLEADGYITGYRATPDGEKNRVAHTSLCSGTDDHTRPRAI